MNYGDYSLNNRLKVFFSYNLVARYLKVLRKLEYAINNNLLRKHILKFRLKKLSYKTGILISPNVFGYGLVIPHHGTIVVGAGNKIGNYCVLHTSICITEGNKIIGDGFYLSSGAKVYRDIIVKDNVSVTMNSVLNINIDKSNCLCAGNPAKIIKNCDAWYIRDGVEYERRMQKCLLLNSN